MILHIIIFKNTKINAFTQPQFSDIEPEKAALQLSRSLVLNEDANIFNRYKDLDMYYLGTFDDETGDFVFEKAKLLLNCSSVVDKAIQKLEEKKKEVVC